METRQYRRVPMALHWERGQVMIVDALAEKLDARLREWKPETAAEARERITEVIELADHDVLDIARSRATEQEILDLLDEPPNPVRSGWLT
jgi:hypothetical protein